MELIEQPAVFMGTVLAPPIGMMDQAGGRPLDRHCPGKGLNDKILCHPWTHGIAHNLSGKKILVTCKVKPAFLRGYICNICKPDLVRGRSLELLIEQVLCHG